MLGLCLKLIYSNCGRRIYALSQSSLPMIYAILCVKSIYVMYKCAKIRIVCIFNEIVFSIELWFKPHAHAHCTLHQLKSKSLTEFESLHLNQRTLSLDQKRTLCMQKRYKFNSMLARNKSGKDYWPCHCVNKIYFTGSHFYALKTFRCRTLCTYLVIESNKFCNKQSKSFCGSSFPYFHCK